MIWIIGPQYIIEHGSLSWHQPSSGAKSHLFPTTGFLSEGRSICGKARLIFKHMSGRDMLKPPCNACATCSIKIRKMVKE